MYRPKQCSQVWDMLSPEPEGPYQGDAPSFWGKSANQRYLPFTPEGILNVLLMPEPLKPTLRSGVPESSQHLPAGACVSQGPQHLSRRYVMSSLHGLVSWAAGGQKGQISLTHVPTEVRTVTTAPGESCEGMLVSIMGEYERFRILFPEGDRKEYIHQIDGCVTRGCMNPPQQGYHAPQSHAAGARPADQVGL